MSYWWVTVKCQRRELGSECIFIYIVFTLFGKEMVFANFDLWTALVLWKIWRKQFIPVYVEN